MVYFEAPDLEALFRLAAEGLRRVLGIAEFEEASGGGEAIELRRGDPGRLLVAWLRELLVGAQVEAAGPGVGHLSIVPPSPGAGPGAEWTLSGRVSWNAARGPTREVKAVTYHGLRVERHGDVWRARVLFDV